MHIRTKVGVSISYTYTHTRTHAHIHTETRRKSCPKLPRTSFRSIKKKRKEKKKKRRKEKERSHISFLAVYVENSSTLELPKWSK